MPKLGAVVADQALVEQLPKVLSYRLTDDQELSRLILFEVRWSPDRPGKAVALLATSRLAEEWFRRLALSAPSYHHR